LNFRKKASVVRLRWKEQSHEGNAERLRHTRSLKAQWQQTLDDLAKGIRRPDKMKAACERMDRMREENRKLFGEQNSAVDLIRETRDQA